MQNGEWVENGNGKLKTGNEMLGLVIIDNFLNRDDTSIKCLNVFSNS